jgi:uncharacterized protein
MSEEVLEGALDLAFSDGAAEGIQLAFFGGEPLLEWELLRRATLAAEARARASRRRLQPVITTNGTRLDAARRDFLIDHAFFIGLSIDGCREAHEATRPTRGGRSSFDAAARALRLLVEGGAWFETLSVIDPANVRWLGRSARFLVEAGVTRMVLNPNFSGDFSDDDLAWWRRGYEEAAALYLARAQAGRPIYLNVVEDKLVAHVKGGYLAEDRCKMGHGAVAVAPSGNLYPCARLVGEDRDPSVRIGDVFTGLDGGRRLCLDAQAGPVNEECGGCGVRSRCLSFCACAARAETGELGLAGGLLCWHEKMAIEIADAVGARLWRQRNRHFVARVYGAAS